LGCLAIILSTMNEIVSSTQCLVVTTNQWSTSEKLLEICRELKNASYELNTLI
jgi:hypothetical protein